MLGAYLNWMTKMSRCEWCEVENGDDGEYCSDCIEAFDAKGEWCTHGDHRTDNLLGFDDHNGHTICAECWAAEGERMADYRRDEDWR